MFYRAAPKRRSAIERTASRKYRAYSRKDIDGLPQLRGLSQGDRDAMKAVAAVLPFRVNNYVVEELIDWSNIPADPIYQLTFPQPEMLGLRDFSRMFRLVRRGASDKEIRAAARDIQSRLNPHPAGQMELNVPAVNDGPLPGMQHKYRETALLFPAAGQTCHAYCSYCFRWAQFVGIEELKFASRESGTWVEYLRNHPEIRSVLVTGGDPMVMKAKVLRRYVEPLLDPALSHIESIRIGSKSTAYWPHRYVTDSDADEVLELFQDVRNAGRHLAFMAHYSHPRELETPIAEAAIRRIQDAGAVVRCQAPLIRHVNDSVGAWVELWRRQERLGAVPYYMFVERDTGPSNYFEVPLVQALEIFNGAYRRQSGLGRTVRGPTMSSLPGKVLVEGVTRVNAERVFVLRFLQARNPEWVGRPFFARFDPEATWLDDLEPAFGERHFFFERQAPRQPMRARHGSGSWVQLDA
jgi:L-lysine 2,3-aminomutase